MLNLNVHSAFDFLNSNITLPRLLDTLIEDGQTAFAVTDFNRMHAVYQFMKEATDKDIKAVPGMEILIEDGLTGIPLVLLAKDQKGYLELVRLSAMLSYKRLVRTPLQYLVDNIKHSIAIIKTDEGLRVLQELKIHDEDKYISYQCEGMYKKVFIKASHYVNPSERGSLKVLNAIRDNEKLSPEHVSELTGDEHIQVSASVPEEAKGFIKHNEEIFAKCEVPLPQVDHTLPVFKNPYDEPSKDYLWRLLQDGFKNLNLRDSKSLYQERMKYEYDIIVSMGFEDYFLIVQDLVAYAKNNGIYVGPGRGSSSASLVSYILNITEVDPLEYNLLFERFLNPERINMPDIDIDFEDSRRDEVVNYLINKYGTMNVSNIVTYGTLSAKMAARDVGRVLGFSEDELKLISGIIPSTLDATLSDAFNSKKFKTLEASNEKYKVLKEVALKIEGLPRHTSTHAAGVLLSRRKLTDDVPILFQDEHVLSQWPMKDVEAAGLLKIDLLGLKNLSLIRYMVTAIKQVDKNFSLSQVTDDPRVYKMLSLGMTLGIFQLESNGIRRVIEKFKPKSINDLAAVLSLYRPGPMKEIDNFIYRKEHPETIEYLHEDLEDILKETFGIIVYQEQIMQIAGKVAGFTYGQADILRRAMGKKDRETLTQERSHFLDGAVKQGYSQELATRIFDLIMEFANYGFVKSHAVAYSKVAYVMAYIKLHYPAIFYSVILTHHKSNEEKTNLILDELKTLKIPVHLPDVNRSKWQNTAADGILIGFSMISGLSKPFYDALHKERKNRGDFKDIYDFVSRVDFKFTAKLLRNLIISGSFDFCKENRKTMLQSITNVLEAAGDEYHHESFLSSLGFSLKKDFVYAEEMSALEKIEGEKEVLGFYTSDHPVLIKHKAMEYIPFSFIHHNKKHGIYLLYIEDSRTIKVKKTGQNMAFLTLSDGYTTIDGVMFAKEYFKYHPLLNEGIVVASATLGQRNDKSQLVIDRLYTPAHYREEYIKRTKKIYIRNIDQDKINAYLSRDGIPIYDFKTKRQIGFINIKEIGHLIDSIDAENFRLIV